MKPAEVIVSGLTLTFALFSLGKVQENSPQSMIFETIKFVLCSLTAAWIFMENPTIGITVAAVSAGMLILFMFIQKQEQPLQA